MTGTTGYYDAPKQEDTMTVAELYKQARQTYYSDVKLTPEQQAALTTARKAFDTANDALAAAHRSRKDKDARVADAQAMVDVARAALDAAREPEKEAEQAKVKAAFELAEQVHEAIAREALGVVLGDTFRYVNRVTTGETKTDYYGTHEVYRTTVDPQPINAVAYEVADLPYRLTPRANGAWDLTFEVVLLEDEEYEKHPGLRKERFGYSADVRHRSTSLYAKDSDPVVEVAWGSAGGRSIEDAEKVVEVYRLAIRVARIVERIAEEAK